MVRRYVLSIGRAFVLAGLAVAGLLDLVISFLAATARRLAARWCGVDIPTLYKPEPSEPEREADGWYRDGNTLYESPKWITETVGSNG